MSIVSASFKKIFQITALLVTLLSFPALSRPQTQVPRVPAELNPNEIRLEIKEEDCERVTVHVQSPGSPDYLKEFRGPGAAPSYKGKKAAALIWKIPANIAVGALTGSFLSKGAATRCDNMQEVFSLAEDYVKRQLDVIEFAKSDGRAVTINSSGDLVALSTGWAKPNPTALAPSSAPSANALKPSHINPAEQLAPMDLPRLSEEQLTKVPEYSIPDAESEYLSPEEYAAYLKNSAHHSGSK